jgi:hypothetical protein
VNTVGRCTTSYLLAGPACFSDALLNPAQEEPNHETRPVLNLKLLEKKKQVFAHRFKVFEVSQFNLLESLIK